MHLTPPSHSTLHFLLLLLFLLTPHIFVFYLSLLCVYLACILFYILNIKYSLLVYVYRYRHPGMFAHGDKPLCTGACVCICVWRSAVDIGNLFECFSSFLIEKESPGYTQISMVPAILANHLAPGISFPATDCVSLSLSIYMSSRELNSYPYHPHSSWPLMRESGKGLRLHFYPARKLISLSKEN